MSCALYTIKVKAMRRLTVKIWMIFIDVIILIL